MHGHDAGMQDEDFMKLIIAVIKPFKLEEVREALTAIGVQGLLGRWLPTVRAETVDCGGNDDGGFPVPPSPIVLAPWASPRGWWARGTRSWPGGWSGSTPTSLRSTGRRATRTC